MVPTRSAQSFLVVAAFLGLSDTHRLLTGCEFGLPRGQLLVHRGLSRRDLVQVGSDPVQLGLPCRARSRRSWPAAGPDEEPDEDLVAVLAIWRRFGPRSGRRSSTLGAEQVAAGR
jgi:hypothetical protein